MAIAGLIPLLLILLARPSDAHSLRRVLLDLRDGSVPISTWYLWAGGLFGGIFTAVAAVVLPLLGLTLFTVAVVAGRSTAALVVDHVGLAHGSARGVTAARLLSVLIIVAAVAIPLFGHSSGARSSVLGATVAGLVGGSLAIQGAAGSHLRARSSPIATAWIIYVVTIVLLAAVAGVWSLVTPPHVRLPLSVWPYLGGPLGLISLLIPIFLIRFIGVLVATIATVSGQLVSSMIVDELWPLRGHDVQWTQLLAVGLTVGAVALSLVGGRSKRDFVTTLEGP